MSLTFIFISHVLKKTLCVSVSVAKSRLRSSRYGTSLLLHRSAEEQGRTAGIRSPQGEEQIGYLSLIHSSCCCGGVMHTIKISCYVRL